MAELIAVVFPEGQGGHDSLRQAVDQHGLTRLDDGFAEQLCAALGANGRLALFMAENAANAREALGQHGAVVLQTSLGNTGLRATEVGKGDNPQIQGQRRRESGGESTEESGQ